MKRFDEERNKILILIQRDNHNEPYAKIYYNGQDAFNLSPKNKEFANYIARHILERQLCFSFSTGNIIDSNEPEFDYEYDNYYCLVGSYTGKDETFNLIKALYRASLDKEININLFVTDDISDTICLVKDSVSNLDAEGKVRAESKIRRMIRTSKEVARDNAIKNNDYYKDLSRTNMEFESGLINYDEANELNEKIYNHYFSEEYDPTKKNNDSIVKNVVEIKGFK